MRGWVALVAVAGVATGSRAAVAAAAPPPVAKAVSGWQVDFGAEQCLALRKFDVNGRAILFGLEPDPDGRGARITFRVEGAGSTIPFGWHKGQLSAGERKIGDQVFVWPGLNRGALIISGYHLEPGEAPVIEDARTLTLQSSVLSVTVPLAAMDKVLPLLKDCNAGLLDSWGFSRADQARLGTRPATKLISLFSSNDYPVQALRDGASGEVSVRYTIDEQGRASNCVLRRSSGAPSLDEATCRIITSRGRFKPALDKAGVPMKIIDTARIRWLMPQL